MKIYLNTRYNTETTVESDDVYHLLETVTSLNALVNDDSYIGFNNYLNHQCEDCEGSIRLKHNVLVYVLKDHNSCNDDKVYLRAYETEHGVKMSLLSKDDKDPYLYNRMIKSIAKGGVIC